MRALEAKGPAASPQGDQAKGKTSQQNNNTGARRAKANPGGQGKDGRPASDSGKGGGAGREFKLPEPKPWRKRVGGASLLNELMAVFRRYLALPEGAAETMSLWVVFTHTFDAWAVSPRLAFTSPVLRCGKTTALSILSCLVTRPLLASNVTPAVVFRVIERDRPTLLIDEADTFLDQRGEIKGILNSGHTQAAAYVWRCDGDNYEPRGFSTWAPLAVAKIGKLSATLNDRSIVVPMRRRRADEAVERFRSDRTADLDTLARKAARWAKDHLKALREADPKMPDGLHDRAADNWRPLIAIADQVGDHWPETARRVALLLSGEAEDPSLPVKLLADIRSVFEARGVDRLSSKDLCRELGKMEDRPWCEWSDGFRITKRQLARLLRQFGIRPKGIRMGDKTPRGYVLADFEDAFARYLPPLSATPQQANVSTGLSESSSATQPPNVADDNHANPLKEHECCAVAADKRDGEEEADDLFHIPRSLDR